METSFSDFNHIVYDNEPLTFSTTVNCVKYKQKKKTQKRTKIVAKIKRYRDKMKPDTDKYEQNGSLSYTMWFV
jgi:hypothetical protein